MSLQSIGELQKSIYALLQKDQNIRQMVAGIYLSVQQDAKYPFILITMLALNDISKFHKTIYEIDFEIEIFLRDALNLTGLKISDHLETLILNSIFTIGDISLLSIRKTSVKWVRANDIHSSKIIMHFKTIMSN